MQLYGLVACLLLVGAADASLATPRTKAVKSSTITTKPPQITRLSTKTVGSTTPIKSTHGPLVTTQFTVDESEVEKYSNNNGGIVANDLATERALFIRQNLAHRLHYVVSGKRMADFEGWVQECGGHPQVFSMHGVSNDNNQVATVKPDNMLKLQEDFNADPSNPFSVDMLNLDLVYRPNTPPNQFLKRPVHLLDHKPASSIRLFFRSIQLGIVFAPVLSTVGLSYLIPSFRRKVWYPWVTACMAYSGPAWIKWGQWSSTRHDMFPSALCECLSTLHNDAPSHKWSHSRAILASSLGINENTIMTVFDEFDKKPIASGSIAQVHRAVLDGQTIAVKIRHPKVAQRLEMDFRLMSIAAHIADMTPALRWLRIKESVEQFRDTMAAQADLHVEGHHLEVLNYNFRNWARVRFPQPIYASPAVIMESFETGRAVTDVLDMYDDLADQVNRVAETNNIKDLDEDEKDVFDTAVAVKNQHSATHGFVDSHELIPMDMAKFLVTTGVGLYLKMLLVDNLMHADLHPGNIMIDAHHYSTHPGLKTLMPEHRSHSKHVPVSITLVDAGMVAQLTDHESSTFIGLLSSVGEGDGRTAADYALQFSAENKMTPEQKEAFASDMEILFAKKCRGYGTGTDAGEVLRDVLGLIRDHQVRIDANYATLVINCLCVESLAKRMFPNYNVLDAAKPLLRGYRKLCYNRDGTPKPRARKSALVKSWLSLMYVKKKVKDNYFFGLEAQRKRRQRVESRMFDHAAV